MPYLNPTTPANTAFNKVHKKLRVKVENCFGRLTVQWRRLKYLDVNSSHRTNMVIETCILFHNYAIDHGFHQTEKPSTPENSRTSGQDECAEKDTTPAGHAKKDSIASSILSAL